MPITYATRTRIPAILLTNRYDNSLVFRARLAADITNRTQLGVIAVLTKRCAPVPSDMSLVVHFVGA